MKPRDVPSLWIKHRPWHWSKDRRQPTRKAALKLALEHERRAERPQG